MHIVRRRGWEIAERQVAPEHAVFNRSVAGSSPADLDVLFNRLWHVFRSARHASQVPRATSGATNDRAQFGGMAMTQPIRELYRSANGDRWSLIQDDGKVQVLHEPNAASGGRPYVSRSGTSWCGTLTDLSTPSCCV